MARIPGNFDFPLNFEGLLKGPIDAKQLVGTKADLTGATTWNASGQVWLYDGAIVSVAQDPTIENNGIYFLASASTYTDINSWVKAGTGEGGSLNMTGDTVGGLTTYVDATTICAHSGLTYNGTTLSVGAVKITTGAADGYVLTSDSDGNASWCGSLPNLYTYSAITANQSIGVLPSGETLGMVYITNTGGTTGYYNLGTTPTGNDITPYQSIEVAAAEDVSVTVNLRASNTENKTIYVNSANWTDAGINLQWAKITYQNANTTITIPIATDTVVGGISVGTGLSVDGAGHLCATGGGVAVSGVTDNALTSYINASGDICAEPNLKFDGSTLYVNSNMSFCNGADRCISILNTTSAPSRILILKSQEHHGYETSGDVLGGGICACGGFGNNTSESGGSGSGGEVEICGGTGKIHTGSATGGDVVICGGRGWVTTSGTGTGGTVHLCGGQGDTTGRILLGGLPSKVSETCVVWIDASGNLSTATPASDSRLKCCVTPISSASSMLTGICGYSAEFNNLSNCEGCCEYVFLAQEVEKELPLAVKNGVIINDIDYKKIEYDQLIPVMWNIIKEQEARIRALEA